MSALKGLNNSSGTAKISAIMVHSAENSNSDSVADAIISLFHLFPLKRAGKSKKDSADLTIQ